MLHPLRRKRVFINQRNFVLALAAIMLAALFGFFAYEFKFLRAPGLEILEPPGDITTAATLYDLRGRTDPDADLTLNGRPLYSGGTGEFVERVYLFRGVNRLEFTATNRYGKTTTAIQYIVVR